MKIVQHGQLSFPMYGLDSDLLFSTTQKSGIFNTDYFIYNYK